jgi:surface antigen
MRFRECKALAGRPPHALALASLIVSALCGCSGPILSFQSETAEEPRSEPVVTGSISKIPSTFGKDLGQEDWRRAHAALTVALDPQGNGKPVKWDNPDTAMRGSVNPTGLPYVSNDEICRDFLASVVAPKASRFVRGTGCKPSGGTWELKRLKSAQKSAES